MNRLHRTPAPSPYRTAGAERGYTPKPGALPSSLQGAGICVLRGKFRVVGENTANNTTLVMFGRVERRVRFQ